jgi:DNA-binding response OmpR family regulator
MPSTLQTRRVLILASDASLARAFSGALEAAGFQTACAARPTDGAHAVAHNAPDLVICEGGAGPGGARSEFQVLRTEIRDSAIPCILLAPELDSELLRETIELRNAELLLTPLDPAQLVASVEARLRACESKQNGASDGFVRFSTDSSDADSV